MEDVRVAIVGFGGMGSQYAEIIGTNQIPGLKLTGICCRNKPGQETIRRLYPNVSIYANTDEMFARDSEYDAVCIVTPHSTHA